MFVFISLQRGDVVPARPEASTAFAHALTLALQSFTSDAKPGTSNKDMDPTRPEDRTWSTTGE